MIDPNSYITFIHNYLQQLETKSNQSRIQYNAIRKRLPGHVDTLDDRMEHFIQNECLVAIQLHIQTGIALLESICRDRSYQLKENFSFNGPPTNVIS